MGDAYGNEFFINKIIINNLKRSNMKKKKVYLVAALVVMAVTVLNVKTVLEVNRTYDLAMTSIDALSENGDGENGTGGNDTGENNSGEYEFSIHYNDCTISQTVGSDGTITVFGKKYTVGNYKVGAKFSKTWRKVARDCSKDGNYACSTYTCAQLYEKLGGF